MGLHVPYPSHCFVILQSGLLNTPSITSELHLIARVFPGGWQKLQHFHFHTFTNNTIIAKTSIIKCNTRRHHRGCDTSLFSVHSCWSWSLHPRQHRLTRRRSSLPSITPPTKYRVLDRPTQAQTIMTRRVIMESTPRNGNIGERSEDSILESGRIFRLFLCHCKRNGSNRSFNLLFSIGRVGVVPIGSICRRLIPSSSKRPSCPRSTLTT